MTPTLSPQIDVSYLNVRLFTKTFIRQIKKTRTASSQHSSPKWAPLLWPMKYKLYAGRPFNSKEILVALKKMESDSPKLVLVNQCYLLWKGVRLATVLPCGTTCWVLVAQVWNWSKFSQQHPKCRCRVAKRTQHIAPTNVALACCDRLAGVLDVLQNWCTKWSHPTTPTCPPLFV